MKWSDVCWWFLLFTGLLVMVNQQAVTQPDICDWACPCEETPLLVQIDTSQIPSEQACAFDKPCLQLELAAQNELQLLPVVDTDISVDGAPEEPCPDDCPDCYCHASQAMANLAHTLFQLFEKGWWCPDPEWATGSPTFSESGIFHPPRALSC